VGTDGMCNFIDSQFLMEVKGDVGFTVGNKIGLLGQSFILLLQVVDHLCKVELDVFDKRLQHHHVLQILYLHDTGIDDREDRFRRYTASDGGTAGKDNIEVGKILAVAHGISGGHAQLFNGREFPYFLHTGNIAFLDALHQKLLEFIGVMFLLVFTAVKKVRYSFPGNLFVDETR